MDGIAIRPFRQADTDALAPLLTELGYTSTAEEVVGRMARIGADSSFATFVAEADPTVVGVIGVQVSLSWLHNRRVGRIGAIVIAEGQRGRGIGRRLIAAGEAWMRENGADQVATTSHHRRPEAHAFYLRLGYEQTGHRFVKALTSAETPARGKTLRRLRSSPLVGANLDVKRRRGPGRKVDL